MPPIHNPRIALDGIILRLDPGSKRCYPGTGTSVTDLVSGRTGTMSGGVTVNSSGEFVFDGTDDRIDMGNSYINQSEFTMSQVDSDYTLEAWIYVETSQGTTTDADSIIGNTSSIGVGMQVGVSGGLPRVNFAARSTSNFYSSTFNYNEWVHVCFAHQQSSFTRIFLNGVLDVTSSSASYSILAGSYGNITIGNSSSRVTGYFDGKMGPLSIYNRGLTDAEMLQNFNAHKSRFGF